MADIRRLETSRKMPPEISLGEEMSQSRGRDFRSLRRLSPPLVMLILGSLALSIPTLIYVAQSTWVTEQGGHGPIVLATGLWLLWQLFPSARSLFQAPPLWRPLVLFALIIPVYLVARISQIVEVEGYAMYAMLLIALYSVIGGPAMRRLWFPLIYLGFVFPPPDTVVAFITMPMKAMVSQAAIALLAALGYPIGGAGVMIVIGQYELLVAAACSGLNSIITLSALALFYVYVRHQANPLYSLLLALTVVPIALIANFVRVLTLILLTYYAGDAPAQGFLHDFAGLLTFATALGAVLLVDAVALRVWTRYRKTDARQGTVTAGREDQGVADRG
ncbi:exosortase V [Sphingomonas sp. M1-B02]|uniref:exosortase V n=1 Tax=Sphingomonas sp. M1-B02 TaxID=3114300 RepID=UPI002240A1DC|nr:exosortase V [Sphingomonas sp. S6-11]UZK67725.1 exosortase V [Sphingomonas sp. S6-11]